LVTALFQVAGSAADRAVADGAGTIPELQAETAGADDQVDLARCRGRDQHVAGDEPCGRSADHEAVVGEDAPP
jgi:hypothetical protein